MSTQRFTIFSALALFLSLGGTTAHGQGQPAKAPSAIGGVGKSTINDMRPLGAGTSNTTIFGSAPSHPFDGWQASQCKLLQTENALLLEQNALLKKEVLALEEKLNPVKSARSTR